MEDGTKRWRHWLLAAVLVAAGYAAVFLLTRELSPTEVVQGTARNVISLALMTIAVRAVIRRWLLPQPWRRAWPGHAALAFAFSFAWLWLLTILAGFFETGSPTSFTVVPYLLGPAQTWQLLQGLFAYAAIAAFTALEQQPSAPLILLQGSDDGWRDRFLVRAGEDVEPLRVADIVSITGADDYAEIATAAGTRLVSTTLAEFERLLDPARFLRVHRSAIVNLDHLRRAEPVGGGRMVLVMAFGADVTASRAGAKLLRERLL